MFFSSLLLAGEVGSLIQFQPNTTAKSSEVNQNFNTIKEAVNDNNSRIQSLESLKTRSVTILPPACVPLTEENHIYIGAHQMHPRGTGSNQVWARCYISLPEGVIVKGIKVFVSDNSSLTNGYVRVRLYVGQILNNPPAVLKVADFQTDGPGTPGYSSFEDLSLNVSLNEGEGLALGIVFGDRTAVDTIKFHGAIIIYEYDPTYDKD